MCGGIVTETLFLSDKVYIHVIDGARTSAIYVKRCLAAEGVKPGDRVWWRARTAYWTQQQHLMLNSAQRRLGVNTDIKLEKLGYADAAHPAYKMIATAYP